MGYLRGNQDTPTISAYNASASYTTHDKYASNSVNCGYNSSSEQYECDCDGHRMRSMQGTIVVTGSCSGNTTALWDVYVVYWHTESGYTHRFMWRFNLNSTTLPSRDYDCGDFVYSAAVNAESSQKYTLLSGSSGGTSRSLTFSYSIGAHDGKFGYANGNKYLRVYQRFRRGSFAAAWVYNDVYIADGSGGW